MITLRDIPHCEEHILVTTLPGYADGRWTEGCSRWRYTCRFTDRYGHRYEVTRDSERVARLAVHRKVVLVELQERFWHTKPMSAEEAHYLELIRKFVRRNRYLLAL